MTFIAMAESDALDGVVMAYGKEFLNPFDEGAKQFTDFRTGVSNALQIFRPGGLLADAVSGSDVTLQDLKTEGTTVYVMIPAERISEYGVWLALVTKHAINAVATGQRGEQVLFLLDEFANMGRIAGFSEALTLLPGYGVRVWAIVQDLSHLAQVYGRDTASIILSQSEVKQFFAVQDIMGLPDDHQLLFVKSAPPILAEMVPYWNVSPWVDWADQNPMEGDHPRGGKPRLRLRYTIKGGKND